MAPNDEGSQSGKEASAAVRISDDSEGLPSVGAFPLFRHTLNEKQQLLESLGAADSTNDSQSFQELLLARVPSYIYGEWYHNAAALLLTASFAFLASKLGLGLGVVLLACIALGAYYQASTAKFRHNKRNDIQRELAKMRIEADEEPVEWMNSFLQKFWLIFEPALCTMILENLDAVVGQYLPPFVESVRLTTLTLGTKPFRIESVKTYADMDPKVVCMDWRISFIPSDVHDLTTAERDKRVNPKVVINIHTTNQLKGIIIPAVVQNIAFRGHMRVKIHFMNKFPYARLFEASFLDKPVFDYDLAPLGTNVLGFDINYIPGLQNFVRDQVHAILGPMMYAPNVFMFDVEQFFDGDFDISHANGILAVTVYSASSMDTANGDNGPFATAKKTSLNPFIKFYVDDGRGELGRTKVQKDTFEPEWNETCFLLLNNLNNQLCFEANTQDHENKEERIATGFFDLQDLDGESHSIQEGLDLALYHKGKSMSDLKVDLRYFPVSKPTKRPDGTIEPPAQSNSAVLRLTVHECQDLAGPAKINPYVRVIVNGHERIKTSIAWHTHNPAYEKAGEVVVLDKNEVFVRVEVKDWNKVHKDELLGVWTSHLSEILEKQEENDGWWPLTLDKDGNDKTGKLRLSAQWKPVIIRGLLDSTTGHGYKAPPIGVMRLTFWEARDLRNVEAVTAGKSDPYVRVLSGNQVRERTSVIDNNLSPEWGETLYVPVHSPKEDLTLEVMDWNAKSKDKHLGLVDLKTHELVKLFVGSQSEDPDKWYDRSGVKIDQWMPLRSIDRKAGKGELRFTAEFYPTLALPRPRAISPAPERDQDGNDGAQIDHAVDRQEVPVKDLHGAYIKYTPDDLIDLASYQVGVLRIKIHSVQLPKFAHAYCQVLADSLYPQYKTARAKGRELTFNEISDVFIKEADVSRVAIELRPATADEKDDIKVGYWIDSVSSIVRYIQRQRRMQPDFKIEDHHGEWFDLFGTTEGRIRLSFDFVPMSDFELSPDESIGNQGTLTVTLLRANNLMAADKSGTSDPYVVFSVNGERVHKSATIKKTLDPVWKNEQFTVPIQSRVTSSFRIEVFDWNQIKGDEPIGSGGITLRGDMVESFAAKEVAIPLDGVAGVSGTVRVRFLWQPQLLTKRKTQTTMLSTTRMMTSATLKGPGAGGGIRTATSISSFGLSESTTHSRTASVGSGSLLGDTESLVGSLNEGEISSATGQSGHLKLTLVEARGLHGVDKSGTSDPYVRIRLGKKAMKTQTIMKTLAPAWNETFTQSITEQPTVLSLKILDYNKLGRAVLLGECRYNVWDLVQPDQPKIDRWLPLNPLGSGEVHIIAEYFST